MEENIELDYIEKPAANGNKADKLVILLHGWGSNANDLMSLAPHFAQVLPDAHFIAPNGPEVCEEMENSYRWFPLDSMDQSYIIKQIKILNVVLDNFIDKQLKRLYISDRNLILIGFSQGAMMSLHTGIRREIEPMGIISYSGLLPETKESLDLSLKCKPDILMVHGTKDQVIPYDQIYYAEKLLGMFDIKIQTEAIFGLGHAINGEAIEYGKDFLSRMSKKDQE